MTQHFESEIVSVKSTFSHLCEYFKLLDDVVNQFLFYRTCQLPVSTTLKEVFVIPLLSAVLRNYTEKVLGQH